VLATAANQARPREALVAPSYSPCTPRAVAGTWSEPAAVRQGPLRSTAGWRASRGRCSRFSVQRLGFPVALQGPSACGQWQSSPASLGSWGARAARRKTQPRHGKPRAASARGDEHRGVLSKHSELAHVKLHGPRRQPRARAAEVASKSRCKLVYLTPNRKNIHPGTTADGAE